MEVKTSMHFTERIVYAKYCNVQLLLFLFFGFVYLSLKQHCLIDNMDLYENYLIIN